MSYVTDFIRYCHKINGYTLSGVAEVEFHPVGSMSVEIIPSVVSVFVGGQPEGLDLMLLIDLAAIQEIESRILQGYLDDNSHAF